MLAKISRRDFIRKGITAVGGLVIGAHALNSYFINKAVNEFSMGFRNNAPDELWKWSKEASHYTRLSDSVLCTLCPHGCRLGPNDRGFCRNRVNKDNKLYTIGYGNPCSVHVDPIEKKPLYHFLPATKSFSLAVAGCSFRCLNCQNWQISQESPEQTANIDLMPENVARSAEKEGCASIAYTYSEPSTFYEYMYDTGHLADEKGIKNVWITSGYLNEKPLRELCRVIHAANVDLKGFSEQLYQKLTAGSLKPVLDTLKILKEEDVWFEITNLVVPGYTDNPDMIREMSEWIYRNLGPDYPLHISRFHPAYRLAHVPSTPESMLKKAREIALDAGLHYVYIGNMPGSPAENTYCPNDAKLLIERKGYSIMQNNIEDGRCKYCGEKIAGVWENEA
ncbi:MAG: AmmeMemoRadiSam system radical SAM enzyme [archaeon]